MPDNDLQNLLIEQARQKLAQRMPAESKAASVAPMGWFGRLISPSDAVMTTDMLNHVSYRPERVGTNPAQIEDLLGHEFTHVGQNLKEPLLSRILSLRAFNKLPYEQRPEELE